MPTALISVSDKEGIAPFAEALTKKGWHIIATQGTFAYIQEHTGIRCAQAEWYTSCPALFDGRVKTLNPKIFGGILAREKDVAEAKRHHIPLIDVVVVNLYPFEKAVRAGLSEEECVEQIDIGGHALLRAAAKNCQRVCAVYDPNDYKQVAEEIKLYGDTLLYTRKQLAYKAFEYIESYDALVRWWRWRA